MTRLWIGVCAAALFCSAGCNPFSNNYKGSAFTASSHVVVDTLEDYTLLRYQTEDYRVIGSSEFPGYEIKQNKIEKQARAAAREKGADVVLLNKEYAGTTQKTVETITGYSTVDSYDKKTGETTTISVPEYKYEVVKIPRYHYKAVFLRKARPGIALDFTI